MSQKALMQVFNECGNLHFVSIQFCFENKLICRKCYFKYHWSNDNKLTIKGQLIQLLAAVNFTGSASCIEHKLPSKNNKSNLVMIS